MRTSEERAGGAKGEVRLRVALVWNGTVMTESEVPKGHPVTLGEEGATLVMPLQGTDLSRWELVVTDGHTTTLRVPPFMRGELSGPGGERPVSGGSEVAMDGLRWGIVHQGNLSVFLQWVTPEARLTVTRGADYNLIAAVVLVAAVHLVTLGAAFLQYHPSADVSALDSARRRSVVHVLPPPEPQDPPPEAPTADASSAHRPGGAEGQFGREDATGASETPALEGAHVDHIETPELGRAFTAALGTSGALTDIFGDHDAFSASFGSDFAAAGQGNAFIVGRGDGGLGHVPGGDGGGGTGFGRTQGLGELDTGGGRGRGARIDRREEVQRRATVSRHRPEINGFLSSDHIEGVVRRHSRGLRYCYEIALREDPTLTGRISLNWTIGLDGRVAQATVTEDTIGAPSIEDCVLREVERMRFDQPDGGMVVVTYPLTFRSSAR